MTSRTIEFRKSPGIGRQREPRTVIWTVRDELDRFSRLAGAEKRGRRKGTQLFSAGKLLASAGGDNTVKVWDFEKGEQARTIQAHGKQVTRFLFVGKENEFLLPSLSRWRTIAVKRAASPFSLSRWWTIAAKWNCVPFFLPIFSSCSLAKPWRHL